MRKLIIDTDPGIDDSLAIQFAFASQEFDILGLTTVFGNVGVELTTTNALRLLHLMNNPDIPVAKGAAGPLEGTFSGGVPFIHGHDGQGNTWGEPGPLTPVALSAPEFLAGKIKEYPGGITIAALGPLTNLAALLEKEPGIEHLVREVVFMGGNAFCEGNATPAAEANILSDPVAADIVLGASWPITMVGLDVTHKTVLPCKIFEEIATVRSSIHDHVVAAYRFYLDFYKRVNKMDGTYLHDASVFAYLMNNSFYNTVQYPIRVERQDGISKGKTWPCVKDTDQEVRGSLHPWKNRPKITICTDVKGEEVIQLLRKVLTR